MGRHSKEAIFIEDGRDITDTPVGQQILQEAENGHKIHFVVGEEGFGVGAVQFDRERMP